MLSSVLAAAAVLSSPSERVELAYRAYRDWSFELPAERWSRVSTELPGGFAVELEGTALRVDADGDGEPEQLVEGRVDDAGVRSALAVCRGEDGSPRVFRLRDEGAGWTCAPSGAISGHVAGTKVTVIDQDNDGRFDGYGTDALVLGTGKRAHFLSRVVNLGGALHRLDVEADGSALEHAPYEGRTGVLDLTTSLDAEAKLLTAVVRGEDGRHSFDLAGTEEGLRVPAGRYELHSGSFGLGRARVWVTRGDAESLVVPAGGRVELDWGGPVRAEFAYRRRGDELAFHPDHVWYYGAAGERYVGWQPIGESPEFRVLERESGTELAKAVFPGSS